jgi:AcrR family transcriptional regulator
MKSSRKLLFLPAWKKAKEEEEIVCSAQDTELIEIKHQHIVNGACKLFIENGYHPTTMREIATACGMSSGQLYHYISSKDDVLYLVHKNMIKKWHEDMTRARLEEIEEPVERLVKALRAALDHMYSNRKVLQFAFTETKYLDKKYLRLVLEMADKNVVGFWRQVLRGIDKQKSSEWDLDFAASFITHQTWFLPLRGWNLKSGPKEKMFSSIINFIMKGLGFTQ